MNPEVLVAMATDREWRGIAVSDSVRERVDACADLDQLEIWAQRAVHVTDAAELFVES
ncbi:hypothetical protein ACFY0B_44820 [Streptomyces sp. NPDC001797]|uniref:hypothetical protein n=1 Tax=Streptomyces sp. NPDC001797 TaxID=3364610 RepID=UPI00368E9F04